MVVARLAGACFIDGGDWPHFEECKLAQAYLRRSPPQEDFVDFLWIYARKSQKITMFHSVSEIVKQGDLSSKLEPALGFEPRTDGLQNRSSTAELSWHRMIPDRPVRMFPNGFCEPDLGSKPY